MRKLVTVIAIAALCAAGCGKSEQQQQAEKAAEDLKKAAEGMAKAAEQVGTAAAAQGATDMAKALHGCGRGALSERRRRETDRADDVPGARDRAA